MIHFDYTVAGGPKSEGPKISGAPKGVWRAQNFVFTTVTDSLGSPEWSLCHFRSFSLSGFLVVEFWWCLKRRDPNESARQHVESPNVQIYGSWPAHDFVTISVITTVTDEELQTLGGTASNPQWKGE